MPSPDICFLSTLSIELDVFVVGLDQIDDVAEGDILTADLFVVIIGCDRSKHVIKANLSRPLLIKASQIRVGRRGIVVDGYRCRIGDGLAINRDRLAEVIFD